MITEPEINTPMEKPIGGVQPLETPTTAPARRQQGGQVRDDLSGHRADRQQPIGPNIFAGRKIANGSSPKETPWARSVREAVHLLACSRDLKMLGTSSALVTHNLYPAFQVCDRFVAMSHGAKVHEAPKQDTLIER